MRCMEIIFPHLNCQFAQIEPQHEMYGNKVEFATIISFTVDRTST